MECESDQASGCNGQFVGGRRTEECWATPWVYDEQHPDCGGTLQAK